MSLKSVIKIRQGLIGEKVFRKTTNQITDPLSESPVDPTDTSVNK